MTNNIKSKMLKNKLLTLLGTYFIAFTLVDGFFPIPNIIIFLDFKNTILKISSIGFMLGIFSIIGVIFVITNKQKKPGWIIFKLGVVFTMYLSWLFLTIYGINAMQGTKDFWLDFNVFLILSTPFQIAFLINTKEIIEDFFLIKLNKIIKINIKPFYYILFICFLYLFVRPGG